MRRGLSLGVVALVAVSLLGALTPAAEAEPPGLLTGFSDDAAYRQESPANRGLAFARTREAGGSVVRLFIEWAQIAPTRPPTTRDARNPAWSGYVWGRLDAVVQEAKSAGLEPVLGFYDSPSWAEGPGRPAVSENIPAGTWLPSASAFRSFAEAAARRYSGSLADPAVAGGTLPRVRYWQVWNEPNLTNYLTPQWRRRGDSYDPLSPVTYRRLLNAFFDGVKAVDQSNFVVTAGTAPYGDLRRGDRRMPPALFTRELLCVKGQSGPKAVRCPGGPVRFDALAHHPYPIGPPTRRARNPDDVVFADFAKLTVPLGVALKAGNVYPRRPKQIWATEFSYDSSPPDPDGAPGMRQALYLESAFYLLWRQGVDVAVWFLMRDMAPDPDYASTLQSGVFFRGETIAQDRRKPSYTAFRFPFTAFRVKGRRVELWGLAPRPGRVTIEQLKAGRWTSIMRLSTGTGRVFVGSRRLKNGSLVRARLGSETSLTWRVYRGAQYPPPR